MNIAESNMWQDVCRTCLKMDKNLLNIFQHHKNNKLISEILIEFITVQIQENDGLPMNICNNCLEKVNIAYEFKTMAQECNSKLHHLCTIKNSDDKFGDDSWSGVSFTAEECSISIKTEEPDVVCDDFSDKMIKNEMEDGQNEDKHIENCNNANETIKLQDREENVELEDNFNNDGNGSLHNLYNERTNESGKEDINQNNSQIEFKRTSQDEDEINSNKSFDSESLTEDEKSKGRVHCKFCGKIFSLKYLYVHLRKHVAQLPFQCDICKKRFAMESFLTAHQKIHTDGKPFKCETCGWSFNTSGKLQRHEIIHKRNSYKCTLCVRKFVNEFSLKKHLSTHGNMSVVCEICGKSFANVSCARKHKITHNPPDSFSCLKCGKMFKNKMILNAHTATHSNVKSHLCNYCGKGFKKLVHFENHVRIHTGEKPFVCNICGKTFSHSGTLYKHKIVHTDEHRFSCEKCSKTFRYSQQLKNHMKSHDK